MRKPVFTGSGVAIVTPFTKEAVDLPAFGRLLDWQIEQGVDAVIVCGTTGEASTMSDLERARTISYCVERINGRVPVIAGSGSNVTAHAVSLSRDAQAAGADGLLLVTPYYNKATQNAVSRPCILYNVPSRTGVSIAPETCARLAEHPNIHGIKEASGNLGMVQKIRNLCPDDFYIWSGNDGDTVPICVLGGVGVISVAANIIPAEMHQMTRLCQENNYAEAGKMQLHLKALCDVLFCEVNPIPVKTALWLMGLGDSMGDFRLPLSAPTPENLDRIRTTLKQYGLLPPSFMMASAS